MKPVVKPVVKPVWQQVECLYTRYNRHTNTQTQTRVYKQSTVKPVINPVWQPVVSCKRSIRVIQQLNGCACTRGKDKLCNWQVLRDSRAFKEPRVNRACRVSLVSWARLACKAFRARQDRRVSQSLETQEHRVCPDLPARQDPAVCRASPVQRDFPDNREGPDCRVRAVTVDAEMFVTLLSSVVFTFFLFCQRVCFIIRRSSMQLF